MAKLKRRFGVIGTGKMGSALIRGILKAQALPSDKITASDADAALLSALKEDAGIKTTSDNSVVVKSSEIVLLALKPDMIRPVLQEVKGSLTKDHLIVSIAAGVPIKAIEEVVGSEARIVRVMPNTPALIGQGAAAFSPGKKATREDVEDVKAILEAVGVAVELPEKYLDAVTGLSGSGPAFVFMVIEALADGGVKMGLPRVVAMLLAAQTVSGAAKMVLETKKHPGELKDQVASPGGTTIAGISALERGGLRAALIEAVEAATKRSIELGGNK
ncbi:MAG: pyrroline-5-carboxylate reductase [Nitrospirae bacterium]|nr:pyrroline-5-carboxylate reductase [Nitrospirota bacterium]